MSLAQKAKSGSNCESLRPHLFAEGDLYQLPPPPPPPPPPDEPPEKPEDELDEVVCVNEDARAAELKL